MEKNYPIIEFSNQLWEEIFPVVKEWGCELNTSNDPSTAERIVSNYGNDSDDHLIIGYTHNTSEEGRRYLVKTKEEFLSAVAKLAGKVYNPSSNSISLRRSRKVQLSFKL